MLVGVAVSAEAGTIPWGPRAGFSLKPDQFVIGGHAKVAEPVVGWGIVPNFDLGFGDDITTLQINGDFVYNFPELETYNWGWYAGAGLTWANYWFSGAGSSGEIGLSLLGGVSRILDNENRLSLELRFGIDDIPDFMLTLGYWFF
jgi:hypothetical protein